MNFLTELHCGAKIGHKRFFSFFGEFSHRGALSGLNGTCKFQDNVFIRNQPRYRNFNLFSFFNNTSSFYPNQLV